MVATLAATLAVQAMAPETHAAAPVLKGRTEKPLRYRPVDNGFVIENGTESFNRPLYGGPTAFRADAGDRPEFSLYLPGRGGVLRVGIATDRVAVWLRDAGQIEARYVDAAMHYRITDPALPGATVRVVAAASRDVEGLLVRVEVDGLAGPADVIFAYGGANGERAKRNGDIGTEAVPMTEYFALKPEHCRDNAFELGKEGFEMRSRAGRIAGVASPAAVTGIADARQWAAVDALRQSVGKATDTPVALASVRIAPGEPAVFALQRLPADAAGAARKGMPAAQLSAAVDRALEGSRAVARQVVVDTPDPFVNSAVAAMCVAADAIWDEPSKSVMHGGVAWRTRLLGWRGPYSGDATGAHDRTRSHLDGFFSKQNTSPVSDKVVGADVAEGLARSEQWLHSNGNFTAAHYDMNLVAVDTFFRHLLWTGDRDYAAKHWPAIKRHLDWEKRLFRRPYGPEKLPLYEAYACIWASDDLQYHGGGATHSTAYNYYHQVMAARVAEIVGEDPAPYRAEAALIRRAMREHLWLGDRGSFAEFKDLLGLQLVHPSIGLWTHYHTIDSQVPDAFEAWQMCEAVETEIPRIPIHGEGVPSGDFSTMATTSWMPYMWSINNVALAEVTHTALADWQAGRNAQAFATWKGALLDSMYMGICPGNLHMVSSFDPYRRESQRDSGDPIGATWRSVIEGLFGITPDGLGGELLLRPGFPAEWDRATITHPDVTFSFKRQAQDDSFSIEPKFPKPMSLRLRLPARGVSINKVTVNGTAAAWRNVVDSIGRPQIELVAPAAGRWDVAITWGGEAPAAVAKAPAVAAIGDVIEIATDAILLDVRDPQSAVADLAKGDKSVRGKVGNGVGQKTMFLQVKQGDLTWWQPARIEIRPAIEIVDAAIRDGKTITYAVRDNTAKSAAKSPDRRTADAAVLLPGTNRFTADVGNGQRATATVTDWSVHVSAEDARWQTIDLTGAFNDSVTQIFKNKYLSPRSPYCSLAMSVQGFGGWASNKTTPEIDDSGLRGKGGRFALPQGVPFVTPGEGGAKNVLFTSQWDNYPRQASVPLTGRAAAAYLFMAGTTNAMQSRLDNGEVVVEYADGTNERLALRNPETWWPIEQDYFVDDYAFNIPAAIPPRVDLKTGNVRLPTRADLGKSGRSLPGGAGTVLNLPLDPAKELRSLTVRTLANEVVIGLMGVTLYRAD
ncbi:MAG TPA: DUF4450 domain-containing protein [Tepidisphaeraceae bacterium]